MNEVEVKFLEVNSSEIIKKLESLGAKKVFEGAVIPSFFDFSDSSLKSKNQLLRLRQKGDKVELAFKQKKESKQAKIAEETEVYVSDIETMRKILLSLGLKETSKFPKQRISYKLGEASYELDTYEGMPTFLEVETNSLETLKQAVEKIGFAMKDAKPWSGKDVLKHYGKK